MDRPDYDVVIIGAGAAGLAAATELAKVGAHSILIVEARDRLGGRIWTCHAPGLAVPIELGAEFIHGPVKATLAALHRSGLATLDARERHWRRVDGGLSEARDELFGQIRRALSRSRISRSKDVCFADFLARSRRWGLSAKARDFAQMMVEGFDAADPAFASTQSIAAEWRSGGQTDGAQARPMGGYGALIDALARDLQGRATLRMRSVVDTIDWKPGLATLSGVFLNEPFKVTARSVIVTLPVGVLQGAPGHSGAVRFSPALPTVQAALRLIASGPITKLCVQFKTAFWEELARKRYADASFFHAPGAPFPTFWTQLPMRVPMLVAWAGGPRSSALAGLCAEQLKSAALRSLAATFALTRAGRRRLDAQFVQAWCHDWQGDPFARGAYSYVRTGGMKARQALGRVVQGTLFFAGEAFGGDESGTVAGALESGTRAARQVISRA